VVIGASSDSGVNGGVNAGLVADGLSFSSTSGTVELFRGSTLVDAATLPAALNGASLSLDPARTAAAENDEAAAFCWGRETAVFDEHGSPGLANGTCETGCDDGALVRDPVLPGPGDLVITEVYANPTGSDNGRDWLELYVAGSAAVELNGLIIENQGSGSPKRWSLDSLHCLTALPATYVVVGGENTSEDSVSVDAELGELGDSLLLGTLAPRLAVIAPASAGEVVVDAIEYGPPVSGVSTTLDAGILDATDNDDSTNWCAAPSAHPPFAGTGSPGEANDACP
jgi:hypothetical protein